MYFRYNTFEKKVNTGETDSNGKPIKHYPHEYCDTLISIYSNEFLESSEFAILTNVLKRDSISFTVFVNGATKCPCVQQPKMRICVDEVETGFFELLRTLKNRRKLKAAACLCNFCFSETQLKEKNQLGTNVISKITSK